MKTCYIKRKNKTTKKNVVNLTKTKQNKRSDISHLFTIQHHHNKLKIYSQEHIHFI